MLPPTPVLKPVNHRAMPPIDEMEALDLGESAFPPLPSPVDNSKDDTASQSSDSGPIKPGQVIFKKSPRVVDTKALEDPAIQFVDMSILNSLIGLPAKPGNERSLRLPINLAALRHGPPPANINEATRQFMERTGPRIGRQPAPMVPEEVHPKTIDEVLHATSPDRKATRSKNIQWLRDRTTVRAARLEKEAATTDEARMGAEVAEAAALGSLGMQQNPSERQKDSFTEKMLSERKGG